MLFDSFRDVSFLHTPTEANNVEQTRVLGKGVQVNGQRLACWAWQAHRVQWHQ